MFLVAEDQGDDLDGDSFGPEAHGAGVPQRVGGDWLFSCMEGTACGRCCEVERGAVFDGVAAHMGAGGRGEQRTSGMAACLEQPGSEQPACSVTEGDQSLLAALARHVEVGASAECYVRVLQRGKRSDMRGPASTARSSSAWSRRPAQVLRLQQAPSKGIDLVVVEVGDDLAVDQLGPGTSPGLLLDGGGTCSGWRSAAYPNSEWIADRRLLRVRMLLWRTTSKCSKKAAMSAASRSEKSSCEGGLPVRSAANRSKRRKVSRYDATVFGLAPRWVISRSVRNAWSVGARAVIAEHLMVGRPGARQRAR